jgi:hypothetical protein
MRIDDTERINAYELDVELRTGKPRQRKNGVEKRSREC